MKAHAEHRVGDFSSDNVAQFGSWAILWMARKQSLSIAPLLQLGADVVLKGILECAESSAGLKEHAVASLQALSSSYAGISNMQSLFPSFSVS